MKKNILKYFIYIYSFLILGCLHINSNVPLSSDSSPTILYSTANPTTNEEYNINKLLYSVSEDNPVAEIQNEFETIKVFWIRTIGMSSDLVVAKYTNIPTKKLVEIINYKKHKNTILNNGKTELVNLYIPKSLKKQIPTIIDKIKKYEHYTIIDKSLHEIYGKKIGNTIILFYFYNNKVHNIETYNI